ncbi:GNAT family N-acetyltransferase [Vibrio crassostreae]|uniref:GNAT family N-acetyltransferase n=1 Tax=Vibrio crassostreae TaxID=246167 RepID=UPI001046D02D|nr:GNAT family N-acetyltransferase [Vibrio crassostreae]TCN92806.1 acetyltransferase (GNAT) family protein [Vibrio crassostreae]CAK1931832.1 Acetyltransferase (GNAT) family protein [Vibrio crassostreae]CAK1940080.1 Acetyltransferase (GNAT) family protein [Vibrio crassostreae]CAK1945512.1 Acetyltransferase (GNAT) family protein [Vibrio crassostreae]CAK2711938.1 Acetyltransferase (GNAT) family protein [Vibrio crassostreae]
MKLELAQLSDIGAIRTFINDHWRREHIFARNESFFNFEMTDNSEVNFLLAKDDSNNIAGLVGFTKSAEEQKEANLFLVILCVLPEFASKGLSFKLINECIAMNSSSVNTIGAAPKVLPLYQLLGFKTGYLEHFFWINTQLEKLNLCENKSLLFKDTLCRETELELDFIKLEEIDKETFERTSSSRRDFYSFNKRYFKHPIYKYEVYYNKSNASIIVVRVVEANSSRAMKVIDYFGKDIDITVSLKFLVHLAKENNYEFVDIYVKGIDGKLISDANFSLVTDKDVTIPNYFSPFLLENVSISYATKDDSLVLFRGDGDQDRPS